MPVCTRRSCLRAVMFAAALAGLASSGCRPPNPTGELRAPRDARAWENQFRPAFDDGYTKEMIQLSGRAPHDVLDQRLFGARMGHADLVALCTVRQVWGRGKFEGKQDQYVEVELTETLIGQLPKGTEPIQILPVRSEDDLPATLQGQMMILFVRWAPEQTPSYHHHLMPAAEAIVGYIKAMISAAKEVGVIDDRGKPTHRAPRRRGKGRAKAKADVDDAGDMPTP